MIEQNSQGYYRSCLNCASFGDKKTIKKHSNNKKDTIDLIVGTCYNENNKLEFIYSGEKTCCITVQGNAVCKHFKWRVE
ncbi:MAG: hypothetical protein ACRCXT_09220 [Paraclostridium sp.]